MLRDMLFPRGKLAHQKINESLEPCETERCQPGSSPQTAVPVWGWAGLHGRGSAGCCWAGPKSARGNPSAERLGGFLELRWPQVFWALRSPPTPADPARSWGMYPVGARGGAHLTMELSPTKQRCFWDLLPIWTLLMGNIPGVKQ